MGRGPEKHPEYNHHHQQQLQQQQQQMRKQKRSTRPFTDIWGHDDLCEYSSEWLDKNMIPRFFAVVGGPLAGLEIVTATGLASSQAVDIPVDKAMRRRPEDNKAVEVSLVKPGVAAAVVVVCGCVGRRLRKKGLEVVRFLPSRHVNKVLLMGKRRRLRL
ncbi:hypothetical protein GTR04_2956 [Trichophyton interdigitale]|nr:hypothetical protein GTR04_2956 [Trichophyton interdigitale]